MWELRPRVPVNIKRRSISAVRDFPKGCGPKVVPKPNLPPPPVELESKPKEAEANDDAASVESSSFNVPKGLVPVDSEVLRAENGVNLESVDVAKGKEILLPPAVEVEGVKINGHVEEECVNMDVKKEDLSSNGGEEIVSVAVEVEGVKINGHVEEECVNRDVKEDLSSNWGEEIVSVAVEVVEVEGAKINGHVEVEVLSSNKCGNGDVKAEKPSRWKGFPALKRRKVSAVRDFPVGCRKGATKTHNVSNLEVGPVISSKSKVFDGKKKVVDDEVWMNGGKAKGSVVGGSVKRAVDEEINGEAVVKSPKVRSSDEEKKKEPVEVGVSPAKKLVVEVKKNESAIKCPKVKSSGEEKKPLSKENEVMEGSDSVSSGEMAEAGSNQPQVNVGVSSSERISEEMKPVTKRGVEVDGSTRVSLAEMVETEEKKPVSSKFRVKSPLISSSSKSTVKDHIVKKMSVQYSSKMELEGRDAKQVSKSLQVKESRDAKPPSGIKIGEKEGGSLEGKAVDKGCIDTPKDGKNLKRKFVEEEGNESLEAFANREIVHALVAAENCPWRSGRKSGGRIPRSATPKVIAKKVKKLLAGNSASASGRASASLHENIVDVEDEKDSGAQDGGNEMAVALYDGPRDISFTMTQDGDESLEAFADREIVHALVAAENCPWRSGRKSGGRIPRSTTPKVKATKVKKLLAGNSVSASGRASASLHENIVDVEDEEDSGAQDGGNEMAVTLYDGPRDLSFTMTQEGDESLEAFADREIVHALVAAENCPRRSGRKSGGRIPRSATPKVKAMKVKKLLAGNSVSASGRASASLHENIVDVEDEEDSGAQDGGNEMAVVLYDGPRELCITMTPAVPPGQVSSSEEAISRNMVKKTLRMFQLICRKLVQGEEKKSKGELEANSTENAKNRVDLKAASMLKDSKQWVNHGEPIIGQVPGVEVGDEFHFRVELSIIGLHRSFQAGIDYTRKGLATSIVASGGYPDDVDSSDLLIYSGSGGNAVGGGSKQAGDQKLERGNLALKNSMDTQSPVRVVYGSKELVKSDPRDPKPKMVATFTYDGLYIVEKYWPERGNNGFNVFKFQLRRMPGQPETAVKEVKKTKKSKVREGLCVKDISDGKERLPICAVNTVDSDQPMSFDYITRVIYPSWYVQKPPRGCDCTDGCSDSEKCACAVKNGGEIPFNYNGAIVQAKPLVYECGPSCKCPPTCHNRVSQHGIKLPLEIFKTRKRGWGVRSLYSIPSGTFVCEYVGEMLGEADAEQRNNDEYLFDIGHNYDDHTLWEGLPSSIPGLLSDAVSEAASENMNDACFTIDAADYGNVGRFINHCCSPNLYAQNLLYDHDDKKMPHVMFFAIDNIPPLQELTYHYNYSIDQVRDSAGNIKKKECLCGSPECTGRLY